MEQERRVSFLSQGKDAWHHAHPPFSMEEWTEFYRQKVALEIRMHVAVLYDQMPLQRPKEERSE